MLAGSVLVEHEEPMAGAVEAAAPLAVLVGDGSAEVGKAAAARAPCLAQFEAACSEAEVAAQYSAPAVSAGASAVPGAQVAGPLAGSVTVEQHADAAV